MAVLFVTHDLGVLAGLAQQMVVMYGGQLVEQAPTDQLFAHPEHPYTQALIFAAPHPELKGQRLPTIPGAPPHPGMLPSGCRFHPRCAYVEPACMGAPIGIDVLSPGREVRCVRAAELRLSADVQVVG